MKASAAIALGLFLVLPSRLAVLEAAVEVPESPSLELAGISVVPHLQSRDMRYRREPDFSLGARVQLFLRNAGNKPLFFPADIPLHLRGRTPEELLRGDEWSWHDLPSAWTNVPLTLPPGALTVWSWNGKRAGWGTNTDAELTVQAQAAQASGTDHFRFQIPNPEVWLSAVTFLGAETDPFPDSLIFHIANDGDQSLRLEACRLWLPKDNGSWRALLPGTWLTNLATFPADGMLPAHDRGGASVVTGRLPLTYTALEVRLTTPRGQTITLWARLRIKRECFDISGGWVASGLHGGNTLQAEPYLKTLRRMHVNTGMHQEVPGYSDTALFQKYPLKYMNRLQPFDHYDTEAILPRIHAVEFLGEPQYGGGRPVPPMEVWRAFAPYQATRLATSVTHSEERVWRFYAGLSDYPHYDAYRVTAPSPDAWAKYDRWDGQVIRWGAPLETIGDMTRSLRELNRPGPIAYWSQGAHDGWEGYGGRKRGSPTPDELRVQAYHALSSRITSLYWFNLSLKSLLKFPDLMEPIARIGREVRMLEPFYLEGDAFHYERVLQAGKPDWDLAVVAGPRGALLFALDLAYHADPAEKVFKFGSPREASLSWPVPNYLSRAERLWQVDADGLRPVGSRHENHRLSIKTACGAVNIFLLSADASEATRLETRRGELVRMEESIGFDPAHRPEDLRTLRETAEPSR